jgi:heme exporter protein CcmD
VIEGGWVYVWASYALTIAVVGGLAFVVLSRLRHWSARARALDGAKQKETAG